MRYLLGLLSLLLFSGSLAAQESDYATLLVRAQSKDSTLDFVELREAYMASPGYSSLDLTDVSALWKPVRDSDPDAAERAAQAILQKNYLHLDDHHVMFWVAKQ